MPARRLDGATQREQRRERKPDRLCADGQQWVFVATALLKCTLRNLTLSLSAEAKTTVHWTPLESWNFLPDYVKHGRIQQVQATVSLSHP